MNDITDSSRFRQGAFSTAEVRAVVVHDGRRGDQGVQGEQGEQGVAGQGFNAMGVWVSGTTYSAGDAVTSASSLNPAVSNLFIQLATVPPLPSLIPPKHDPFRWSEVGVTTFNDAFGSTWQVTQTGHGLQRIGQPVTYDPSLNGYKIADVDVASNLPLAVVTNIIDANTFELSSAGKVKNPDPALIFEGGGWVDNALYYMRANGLVTATRPTSGFIIPVLRVVEGTDAVIFPADRTTVASVPPAPAPATSHVKVDDISGQFNGTTLSFPLLVNTAPVAWPASTESFRIYIDGNPQQPLVDFTVVEDSGNASITFTTAPESFMNFWGVYAT